jgi:hypothetical protein
LARHEDVDRDAVIPLRTDDPRFVWLPHEYRAVAVTFDDEVDAIATSLLVDGVPVPVSEVRARSVSKQGDAEEQVHVRQLGTRSRGA